jgi:hypothetical protein
MCCRAAGVWASVDRLQPHQAHQATYAVAACMEPVSWQVSRDLAASEERVFCEYTVEFIHQLQRLESVRSSVNE